MGVGETSIIDERGRITIPSEIRNKIGKREFNIQLLDKDTIILKAINNNDTLRKIQSIKLMGDPKRSKMNFSDIKDKYGAKKVEAP